ncbi:T9SS type A sorting domain-containing protein [Polaribacter filamentus]|uniref:T9SS type A sorting domain-containing protein n=1 Tax=Polaribacter filamentus TaxID=53483 RepID=UPI0011B06BD4|nr:T9SS type A sorting domain-containing protein [Polaribacter filamentus]
MGPQMVSGPLFSSTVPSNNRIRYFPSLQTILDGELTNNFDSYIGYNQDAQKIGFYETLPLIPRTLSFGLTVRDPNFTKGVYLDSTSVVVVKNTQPFKITSNLAAQNVTAGEITTVTWGVGNTNLAPINAQFVDILLSTDGGLTFPITLAKNVLNDGSETVGFPNINTTDARIKIHPVNKIFFAINEGSFSIIPSDIVLFFENLNLELNNCDLTPQSFSTAFQYQTAAGFSETSALSIAGLPAGLTATLSQNSVSASDTDIDIDFQADATLTAGTYAIDIIATAASKTVTKQIQVIILNSNTAITTLVTPADTSQNVSLNPILTWVANTNATKYRVQVSKDVSFATTLIDTYTFNTNYTPINLDANTTYYWRVSGVNTCSENTFSAAFSFTTVQAYEQEFSLISHLNQIEIPNGSSSYFITIEDDVPLLDVNVFTSFTGTQNGGLTLKLKGPDGTEINLSNGLASDNNTEELNALADDETDEVPLVSADIINISYLPEQALSVFNSKSIKGDWVLTVTNATNAQGIYIKDFGLKIKASNNYYVPLAISETKTVFGAENRSINLLATNQNKEAISGFSVKITRLPEHGNLLNSVDNAILMLNEVISDTTIIYQSTESEDFLGVDYFYFSVNDQTNDSRPAIIVVNNIAGYKTPKALPAYAATPVNTELEVGLDIVYFYLSDIATINLTPPTNGTASYVNGKVLYTPNQGYIGLDTFSYSADDGRSETTNSINVKVFAAYKTDTKPGFMLEGVMHGHPVAQSIAISGNGSIVATSSGLDPSINPLVFEGHVIVYKRDSQTGIYRQLGNQIFGDNALDQFGGYIALSDDGKILAVATNKVTGYSQGNIDYLRTYQYNETSNTWEQIGQTLTFEGGGSLVDLKLDLNADGSILAISNPRIGFTDFGQGVAEVHQFDQNNNQWNLLGDKFEGELTYGLLGSSISLNAVGDVIAISELLENSRYNKPGYVKIFKYNGISWIQKGKSIRGKETMDRFGKSISINNAGNVIAIGADYELETVQQPGIAGYVSVYSFNESKNDWELKGQTLDGRLESDYVNLMFGHSVSIDGSGDILSVGAPTRDSNGINNLETFTLVYKYNKQNDLWSRINLTNNSGKIGSAAYPKAGSSVALSSDGTVLWNGFKPLSDKRESAVMAYKLISDFEVEIEDVNFAPKPKDILIREAFQEVSESLNLYGNDPENVQITYFISKAPNNGSLKTMEGKEIITGELIPDFSRVLYTSDADATSDYFEYQVFDGEKYGLGLVWIDPISESTLSNNEFELANSILFYPNPTKGVLNIQGDVSKLKSIEVYSILGKRLLEVKENLNEINISNLQSGMYLLRVNTDEASVTYKIVKE